MKTLAAALLALPTLLPVGASACPGLKVEDGWIRQAPKGAMMTAAYARLTNTGKQPLVIGRARAAGFTAAELHRSVVENGMHRMVEGALTLAPGARATLEPGGWHLMLFDPPVLTAGETMSVTFLCGETAASSLFEIRAP